MLSHCLEFKQVQLPGPPETWPRPLDLSLGLQEVLLIEKMGPEESAQLLEVAGSLRPPVAGEVRHWGRDAFNLPRVERYRLRRRIACLGPRMALLSRLTLGENIALGSCYQQGLATRTVLAGHGDLLGRLALHPYLSLRPHEVEIRVYIRALWARELIKQPELIIAVRDETWEPFSAPAHGILFLQDYLAKGGGAALILGQTLEDFHPLANRLLRRENGEFVSHPLSEHQGRPLTDFLPLLMT
jgi:predicted ABC-type transport system involved in lysophospholipase L1 biosynthesis ATPase subunit